MTTIVAVRHGETAWNDEGRMQGWAPVPLNDRGRRQADETSEWLATRYSFDAIHSSDLARTRETTERLLGHIDAVDVEYESAFRERDVGVYQGLTYDTVFEQYPRFALGKAAAEAATAVPESGESLEHVSERVVSGFERLTEIDGTVLLVTHGGPLHMLLGHAKGMAVSEAMLAHEQDNCGVNVFECTDGKIEVRRENATPWR